MPLQATSGAASYDAFGGGVPAVPNYIEDVFSTWLYNGDTGGYIFASSGVSIVSGGMMWVKSRNSATNNYIFSPSLTSANHYLNTNTTAAQSNSGVSNNNFEAVDNGGGMRFGGAYSGISSSATGPFTSWTFKKQPKFFDVVTYTGNGTAGRTISHNLGSTPGCIFIKKLSSTSTNGWPVYHRSGTDTFFLNQNDNEGGLVSNVVYSPTDTTFTVSSYTDANASGQTYVAYLFAHDSGGFGLNGTDNVISCGGFTTDGSGNATVSLGYEPQFIIVKSRGTNGDWRIFDVMRGMPVENTNVARLVANNTSVETLTTDFNISPTSTGFIGKFSTSTNATYVYIAIRRGPMRVPTSGASVFYSAAFGDTQTSFSTGFATDFAINKVNYYNPDQQTYQSGTNQIAPRLTGLQGLQTNTTNAEGGTGVAGWDIQDGYKWANGSGYDIFGWAFKRAPSFADVVCYTGTGSNTTVTHNLGAVPELIFVKRRDTAAAWDTYCSALANTEYLVLNTTAAKATGATRWNSTTPTSSVFSVGTSTTTNASAGTYVAYLFSTCAGVSKVGGYTGTGSTQTINCGFAASARFILIKRTNTTGNWFVYDSYRGIQSGNDPYLLLNDSAAAVLNTDYVAADSTGFQVIGTGLNVNAATYIFLAIA